MQEFRNESLIPDVIEGADALIPHSFPSLSRPPISEEVQHHYNSILQQTVMALDNLMVYLAGRPRDGSFVNQLRDYVRRLLGVKMAISPEEQFQHLYAFRKWLLWIPLASMRSPEKDYTTLLVLAYLYAIALQMDALYPNVAPVFCSAMAERPLKEIFREFDKLQMQQESYGGQHLEMQLDLLSFPRRIATDYFVQKQQAAGLGIQMGQHPQQNFEGYRHDLATNMGVPMIGVHGSPAFGLGQRHRKMSAVSTSSSKGSPLPEVPILPSNPPHMNTGSNTGFRQISTTMSQIPLGSEPAEDLESFGQAGLQYSSGFVSPSSWARTCST